MPEDTKKHNYPQDKLLKYNMLWLNLMTFPAYDGYGNTEQCGFNLALGELNIESHQTGDGWGLAAVAYGTQYCTL